MSRVMRATAVRHAVFGLALAGLAMSSTATANAGDFDGQAYGPYPRYDAVPPVYRRAEVGDAFCRILQERRIDPYGRETIHRIRICDEGPVGWTVPQEYGYGPPPPYQGTYYGGYPRPPALIGPVPQEYGYGPPPPYQDKYYGGYPPRPPALIGPAYYN
ncbi:MAG: hypothetical protein WAN49_06700 [Pseudolabrys sp.]|jgi:hypothetical protein